VPKLLTHRSSVAAVAVVLVLVMVGAAVAGSSPPDDPVSSGPLPADPPPVDTGPQLVEPRPGMADVYARPFDRAMPDAAGTAVTVDFVSGVEPCSVLDHVDVGYRERSVTITLFEGHDPAAGDVACIEIGVFKRVVVALDEPLHGRRIVDGAA
jgi:hypothetical protein